MAPSSRKTLKHAAMAKIRAVEEILRRWDLIGIEPGTVAPADEYDAYARHIVSMVHNGCSIEELAAHLERLGSDTMGISPSSAERRSHNLRFAVQVVNRLRQGAS
jgi:hypothetical protein